MIAYIQGKIAEIEPAFVIIDCNGVGYKILVSLTTHTKIRGQGTVKLHTYHLVREDAQLLYGFADKDEMFLFELLISVSGVGANTAITMLSSSLPREIAGYIQRGDVSNLKRIKGIGEKTAARIVLELKDKLTGVASSPLGVVAAADDGLSLKKQEALTALLSLGFPKAVMEKRIADILKAEGNDIAVEQLIKLALRNP